jgi:natural product biosynthesis luciferase-like monooxygenase protein
MDFSLFYFADDSAASADAGRYELLLKGAEYADTHGFAAVWTPERHFHPFGGLYPNPAVTGAAIAAITRHVAIRAGSVVAPLHHPLRIAEEWSVVDNLSGGRVGISFASGWNATDFALRPEAYAGRRAGVVDAVHQVRALWRGEAISVPDGFGNPVDVRVFPQPVQPDLPVWLTAAGTPDTFRAAGELGAGVLTHLLGQDLGELADKIRIYRKAVADRPGGDGWPGHVALMVHTFVGTDPDAVRAAVEEPFLAYLKSSFHLFARQEMASMPDFDPADMTPEDIDYVVRRSFDRHYAYSGMFGTVEQATRFVGGLADAGVDEVACLIDFGIPAADVLGALDSLDQLRVACEP